MELIIVVLGILLYRIGGSPRSRSLRLSSPQITPAPLPLSPRVCLELIGATLDAGLPLAEAFRIVARIDGSPTLVSVADRLRIGLSWDAAWSAAVQGPGRRRSSDEAPEVLREVLGFAARSGAPSANVVRARAEHLRRTEHREAEKLAGALGVRLVVPLGLCSLPSFICLGVIPVLIGMVPDTG